MAAMANPWGASSAIISGAQDAIIGRALDGTIASWNTGAERLLGYTATEALGRSAGLLVAGPRSQDLLAAIRRIQDGEWVPPYEDAFRCKDGNVLLVSVAVSPVMDEPRQLSESRRSSGPSRPDRPRRHCVAPRSKARSWAVTCCTFPDWTPWTRWRQRWPMS